jgi:hypothetical protein
MKKQNIKHIAFNFVALLSIMLCGTYRAAAQTGATDKAAKAMTDSLTYLNLTPQQQTQALSLDKTAATSIDSLAKKAKQDTSLHGKYSLSK